jgi:hypothetical protein
MDRWTRGLASVEPRLVATVAAALSALLLLLAFAVSLAGGQPRAASFVAAAAFLLQVVVGLSLYAWRLGAPGRSE